MSDKKLLVFYISEKLDVKTRQNSHLETKTSALFSIELLPCMEKSEVELVLLVVHTLLNHIEFSEDFTYS